MTIASARLMQKYLEDGKLNPKHEPTRKGFLRLFAAWILEEDLPFVTGEAPGLHRLFEYLQVRFELPTDTTVRNTLAHIFADLHAEVVKELAVSSALYLDAPVSLNNCRRLSSRRSLIRQTLGPLRK